MLVMKAERRNEIKINQKKAEKKEGEKVLSSWPVEYYLKHRINEKLIEGLVDNNRFNDSLSRARVGKEKGKSYNMLPQGPIYEAILKKKITKKEEVRGNFEIPCSIGGLKHVNALVDQGSDVNVMPYSTYMKLTNEIPVETDIRLSLASHSYIYPLGIAEDVLVEVVKHVYPIEFMILDIKENEKRPFILGTPFLITAKAGSPGMGRKDKASLRKGDGVQPMEEQKFQRQASHSYYNQGRNGRQRRSHVIFDENKLGNSVRIGHIARNCTQPKHPQNSDYFKDKMLLMQAQENGAVLDEEELLFLVGEQSNTFDADVDNQPVRDLARNEDNIFQADECDAFDSDVDDEPTAQSIFMANLSSAGPTNLQASSSDASILSEVPDLENANVASNNDQVEHEIHSEVQQSTVIDSNNADMGNSNVIPYEQYLTTNDVSVVPSCASSAPNTAYVLIDNNVHTPNEPLVTELAIYKEQVAIYEQRAKFELTEREQRMDDQMRILIQDRNRMEEKLKQELHSVKLQLNHSIKSQTVIQENVNTLQQTFKQRESQLLNDFSNLRKLKDKLENKLHAQDQSIQTVHMMLKPKKLCEQYSEIAIGAHNPFYLRKAKVAQPTLYDGNEIINPDHDPTNVPSPEAMKAVFENMEAEVDQNAVDKKCGEIERKNLLITNENLIAECLSKDVVYTATDSVLNVSRFSNMHDAFTIAQKRIAD
ncbi:retrovirus-related pol polyprotein from transposon TNT 1-94 [Tanacetum coccineum]